jgi:cation diffusion facilitator family transporter
MSRPSDHTFDAIGWTATASVVVALVVTAIKYAAYAVSGSVALYSDALEGAVNVVSAVAVLLAIMYARQPADHDHPFGHHKAEYLAAGFEGGLIAFAAVLILVQAYEALIHMASLKDLGWGAAISILATVVNAGWGAFLVSRGTAWKSPALTADGWHVLADVWTTIGVLLGLGLVWLTGAQWLDPAMAALVAVYILWTGYRLLRVSLGGLLDEAVEPGVLARIEDTIRDHGTGALQVHDMRTRRSGRVTFVEFHLVVPGTMSVGDAHDICDRLEAALETALPGADVTIHVEPGEKAKDHGAVVI